MNDKPMSYQISTEETGTHPIVLDGIELIRENVRLTDERDAYLISIDVLEAELTALENDIEQLEADRDKSAASLDWMKRAINHANHQCEQALDQRDELQKRNDSLVSLLDSVNRENSKLRNLIDAQYRELERLDPEGYARTVVPSVNAAVAAS